MATRVLLYFSRRILLKKKKTGGNLFLKCESNRLNLLKYHRHPKVDSVHHCEPTIFYISDSQSRRHYFEKSYFSDAVYLDLETYQVVGQIAGVEFAENFF